jgi:hypothetical protein
MEACRRSERGDAGEDNVGVLRMKNGRRERRGGTSRRVALNGAPPSNRFRGEVNVMECVRCRGLMVPDRFVDLVESGQAEFPGWRCLACGNITDPVIVANRRQPPTPRKPLRKREYAA